MAVPLGPLCLAARANARLLDSGMLADAEIRCGDSTWKVHKAILSARCVLFEHAFTNAVEGAEADSITIDNFDQYEVEVLLRWLYTGVVWRIDSFSHDTPLTICIKLWKLADFFLVDDLKGNVMWNLELDLYDIATHVGDHISPPRRAAINVPEVTYNIRALYEDDNDKIRDVFCLPYLAIILLDARVLSEIEDFKELILDIPKFAEDWVLGLEGALGHVTRPINPMVPYFCGNCDRLLTNCIMDPVKMSRRGRFVPLCPQCFKVPTWKDWVE